MAFDIVQALFLVLLLFCLYGFLKAIFLYREKHEMKYMVLLAFFLIAAPQLWLKAYKISAQDFLTTFQFILTVLPLLIFMIYDYQEKRRRAAEKDKQKIKSFFESYVSPKIIEELMQKEKIELSGKRQNVTVFFMDIRGFTKMSEALPAEQVVKILNKYFDIATTVLYKYDGTVDKFVGDAVMALFNAPTTVKDHEEKAFKAALEIQKELQAWGKITAGIGIHTGEAVIGNVGSQHRMDYTAIGDTVNTAARLEGQTAGGDIVVSREVYDKVKHKFKTRHNESVQLKGKKHAMEIYRFKTVSERYV
jgi:adenylate cyclase